jgi:hypothetical protein
VGEVGEEAGGFETLGFAVLDGESV